MRLAAMRTFLVFCLSLCGCGILSQQRLAMEGAAGDFDLRLAAARNGEQQGDQERARKAYQDLLAENANHPLVHHRLGVLCLRQGAVAEGLSHFERAAALAPEDAEVLTDYGYALYTQGQLQDAESRLRNALAISPNNKRAANNLGLVLGKAGRTQEAYKAFRQVGTEAEALANLGYVHSQLGNLDEAAKHFSRSLDEDSQLTVAAEGLMQIAQQKKVQAVAAAAAKAEPAAEPASPAVAASAALTSFETLASAKRERTAPPTVSPERPLAKSTELAKGSPAAGDTRPSAAAAAGVAGGSRNVHAYFTNPGTQRGDVLPANLDEPIHQPDSAQLDAVRLSDSSAPAQSQVRQAATRSFE